MQIKYLAGLQDFSTIWQAMHDFTAKRDIHTTDELWVLEHLPVFTQGQAGQPEHILNAHTIPIIATDRGGQVTYHGPGQIILYVLYDLKRAGMGVRELVCSLEQAAIQFLAHQGIHAENHVDRPGVYIQDKKIASIGLRIKKGYSLHGMSFNVAMDLTPFTYINPCGYAQLQMTQLTDFLPNITIDKIKHSLAKDIVEHVKNNGKSSCTDTTPSR